ncbi:Uncharacterised protein [BD1-7 clade bacterium]|uniref:Peptidase C45 hydrolase domain-containing protein n=1 Tax=BD1-7 clade bacterium TaxID=2029982 RepID=A0A5S9PMV0_9GAMM|nr:Uncharacterised protein [BD1-7 clade bacterium]
MQTLTLNGTAKDRGHIHGEQMRAHIHTVLAFYQPLFERHATGKLTQHVSILLKNIEQFRPDYITEMTAIAEAANVDPFWIYCINARSELISSPLECSTVALPKQGLLAQNWDWSDALKGHIFVADIELENGLRIKTMTEPGMLGKIGLNSQGIGVCLNILPANQQLTGLPVHILLRALLECTTLDAAKKLAEQHGNGKASHIAIADEHNMVGVELAPDNTYITTANKGVYLHTNHYLTNIEGLSDINYPSRTCSETRLQRLQTIFDHAEHPSLDTVFNALNDTGGAFPILRSFTDSELIGNSGTLTTLIMDLKRKTLLIREGNTAHERFHRFDMVDS